MELLIYLTFLSMLQLNAYRVLGIRISQQKCDDYRKKYQFRAEEFIDEEAAPNEFPFMAIIERDQYSWNGILISEKFVLSTATGPNGSIKPYVMIGDLDEETSIDDDRLQRFDIIDEFLHPQFNAYNLSSNVLLLQLNGSVNVRPACLSQPESEISEQLLQIGWSDTKIHSDPRPQNLQLNYIPDINCSETYTSIGYQEFVQDIASGQTFCAGVKKGDREICGGYDGSALLNKGHDSMDEIIGIASFQFACKLSYPHLFVRVSSYLDWIESIVWPNETVSDILYTDSTLMSHTTITTEASTVSTIASKTEEQVTHKVERTTEDAERATHKVEITGGTKTLELKFVVIIVAVLLLILCVLVVCLCLQCNKSRNLRNVDLNVQYSSRD